MFFGLSNFLKKILPKRLFYRALLIVAIPVIVLQLIITIVFFDSLWIKTNKGMTKTLVKEISTFIEVYDNEKSDKEELSNLFSLFLDLNIEFFENENFNSNYNERWFSPIDRTLRRELKSKFEHDSYWFNTTEKHQCKGYTKKGLRCKRYTCDAFCYSHRNTFDIYKNSKMYLYLTNGID